jgi:diadenosine tetraphosphate (Ap4A) HIT family hydrolase
MVSPVSYKCSVCSFELWFPIVRLSVSCLGLNNDSRFPGRCLLVLNQHAEHFAEIESDVVSAFIDDARVAAQAIQLVTKAPRINYAILGNKEPHVHFHLIPRGLPNDPIPGQAPWEHPVRKGELLKADIEALVNEIRSVVTSALSLKSQKDPTVTLA